jgi:hypothetical protein
MAPLTLECYRNVRFNMVSGDEGIRAYRVHGDLIRHSELHRDLQRGLAKLRLARRLSDASDGSAIYIAIAEMIASNRLEAATRALRVLGR